MKKADPTISGLLAEIARLKHRWVYLVLAHNGKRVHRRLVVGIFGSLKGARNFARDNHGPEIIRLKVRESQ